MLPACSNSRPHPRAEPGAVEVLEIGASVYDPVGARGDGPALAADCKHWSLTRQQAETFFRHSQPIADGAGHAFYALPCHIAGRLRAVFRVADDAEVSLEANPGSLSVDYLRGLHDIGLNRLSIGVQSFDDEELVSLDRIHTGEDAVRAYEAAREAGFDNINLDLMFAIPGQTMDMWRQTLNEAAALGSEHLSCYEVIYEEDTPLYEQLQARRFEDADFRFEALSAYVTHELHREGEVLFSTGDAGDSLYYVQRGRVKLVELGLTMQDGDLFGEIGIFSPGHQRTCTACCETQVSLFRLSAEKANRLYIENPRFAYHVVRLIAGRLIADRARDSARAISAV